MDRILEAFPFFSSLSAQTRQAVLSRAVTKKLDAKQVLIRDGGECAYLPFVIEGMLRVYKSSPGGREITLYRIERGESCILSATCIVNGGSFPAVAEAEGASEILLLPAKLIAESMENNSDWRRFLFGLYARRLEDVLTLVDEVAFHHMDSRLAAYLLRHASGKPGSIDRTHGEIADELGTSREVVTRILRDFETDGLVETSRGRIRLRRPDGLRERTASSSFL